MSGEPEAAASAATPSTVYFRPTVPDAFKDAVETLDEMYEVHDRFFVAEKAVKTARLSELQATVLAKLDEARKAGGTDVGFPAYIQGKALAVFETYNKEAETLLSRAVKLDPKNADAWNALGANYWKKRDLSAAKACFEGGIAQCPNPDSYRQLSMVYRQLPTTSADESRANIVTSIGKAKDAIRLDVTSGASWYMLGNALLASFFGVSHDPADLKKALSAYSKAIENGEGRNPDLYCNRGTALKFLEEYSAALADYALAKSIDPSLPSSDDAEMLSRHVVKVSDLTEKKGRVKSKRLDSLVRLLPAPDKQALIAASPAAEGRRFVNLDSLSVGDNPGVMVLLKVVVHASRPGQPPSCILVIDSEQTAIAVSVYHLDEQACSRFGDKDTIIVMDPVVKEISFQLDGKAINYKTIQVFRPETFVVNGRSQASSYRGSSLAITVFDS